jgi:hypothetical protein
VRLVCCCRADKDVIYGFDLKRTGGSIFIV